MKDGLSRRDCIRLGLGFGAAFGLASRAGAAGQLPDSAPPRVRGGITGIRRMAKTRLTYSVRCEPGERLIYQIPFPFQAAPGKAGLFVNLRKGFASSQDFEAGADV